MLPALTAVLLAAACARPPDDLVAVTPWQVPQGGLPTVLTVRPGADATFVPPTPPAPQTGANVAGRTAGAAVLYPLAGLLGAGLCGPAAILCAPVFIAVGIGEAAAEGTRAAQAVRTPEEVAASSVILRQVADPARIGACLRQTLVARSQGRLIPTREAPGGATLLVALRSVSIEVRHDENKLMRLGDFNPQIVLHVTANATLAPDAAGAADAAPAAHTVAWRWQAEPRRYYAATAEDGAALQADIETAVGVLAQRILADLYPGTAAPPPVRHGAEVQQFRAACPPLAPQPIAGQTVDRQTIAARP
jgi:hypothetical protein